MSKPKISIVVPFYNVAEYLPKCLDSLTRQTFNDIEIICVNDGSTDTSASIVKKYAARDRRIKFASQKFSGQSTARNRGIDMASADFIMFCDADDFYETDMCQIMYDAVTKSSADIAICGILVIYHAHHEMAVSDRDYYKIKYSGVRRINEGVIFNTDGAPANKIFRRDLIEKYGIRFPEGLKFEDFYFFAAYMSVSKRAYFVKEKLYNYIRRSGSTMSTTWSKKGVDHSIDHLKVIIKYHDFLEKNNLVNRYRELFWHLFILYYGLSLKYAKSRAMKQQINDLARQFIKNHKDETSKIGRRKRLALPILATPFYPVARHAKDALSQLRGKLRK
jgi:glycosyltransferase involved in cell wall biosynthesis